MNDAPFQEILSAGHLDYLQRGGMTFTRQPADIPLTSAPPDLRRLWHIRGIGRIEKQPVPSLGDEHALLPSCDALIALYGHKIPLAFLIRADAGGVAVHLGTWSPADREGAPAAVLDGRQAILKAAIDSLYPAVDLSPAEVIVPRSPRSGLALGVPTTKPPDPLDGALPLDRLIRALSGANWASLVLAEPVEEDAIGSLRQQVINETRWVQAGAQAEQAPSPLAEHYVELLKVALGTLTSGLAVGAWRTSVYLLGDAESYHRLASVWRGIFSGEKSLPETVRVWDSPDTGVDVAALAADWAMPDQGGSPGPGQYRHLFQYQTLLTSLQLAAYVHLPQLESAGFSVNAVPDFDVVPQTTAGGDSLLLGQVLHRGWPTQTNYAIKSNTLTRHAFVAGVTGSGKSNTIFHLLRQAAALGAPFLVIEPAKTEYRALLNDPEFAGRLRLFTLGDELVSPFRLNPFEVLPGTPIGVHLDLLRSVFGVSFGMWTPLPQVLERCLHGIYADFGWDITTDANYRLDLRSDRSAAFPTLSDLVAKVDEVTGQLGYEERVKADIQAALRTRLNSLRTGGKGRMLDTQRSLPVELLLEQSTVLELEGIGDDDDKAFLMGLLFIRLVEHRRAGGQAEGLRHLLVIEEAHRLLAAVGRRGREEEADPRAKAVETFANLLSEIRAYGQGIIVADQIPLKLAPEVIKNTGLKVAHRVVAADDRAVLAGAMAMTPRQEHALATLTVGQAAVFCDGDDAPLMVKVPRAKDRPQEAMPTDAEVSAQMAGSRTLEGRETLFLPFPACAGTCGPSGRACEAARRITEDPPFQRTFSRIVLSTIEDTDALDRIWPDLLAAVQAKRAPGEDEQLLLRCLSVHASQWLASRRGAQGAWSYADTQEFADDLRRVLLAKLDSEHPQPARVQFQGRVREIHAHRFALCAACAMIFEGEPPVCPYRYAVADIVAAGDFRASFYTADQADATAHPDRRTETWEVCQDAAYEMIEFPEHDWPDALRKRAAGAARRVSLCFGQQMLTQDARKSPRTVRGVMRKLLVEANL